MVNCRAVGPVSTSHAPGGPRYVVFLMKKRGYVTPYMYLHDHAHSLLRRELHVLVATDKDRKIQKNQRPNEASQGHALGIRSVLPCIKISREQ